MKSSLQRGKYLVKNIYLYLFLKVIDFFTFFLISEKNPKLINPKKILLSNIAHLGDALVSTSILPIIKKNFPSAKIGFICSSQTKELLQNNKIIDHIHIVDHWKLNRSKISFLKKLIRYFFTRSKAMKKIKKEKYDIVIDLYYYFPNLSYFFWKTKIPIRIGYTSGGFKNFYTNTMDWINQDRHVSLYYFDLLQFLNIKQTDIRYLKTEITFPENIRIKLPKDFIIFHIGAGDENKMWDPIKWKDLTKNVVKNGKTIIFTGKGNRENELIKWIIKGSKNCINLCNKMSLQKMSYVINKSKMIVCVDSFAMHISSAFYKPTIIIYCGINNYHHWVLKKDNIYPIIHKLKCSPCYKKEGCKQMYCLNNIQVNDVLKQMEILFEKNSK